MANYEAIITPILENIFSGKVCHDGEDQCDYDLTEQADFAPARGVIPDSFVPRVKKTVTYIVMAVIINAKNAVLMMQEAKSVCNGAWYLPAGKVEEGETLEEAVIREVLEETGLEMKPTTLLAVETARYWARFIFTGEIVGGKLKTLDNSDHHSLQAQWLLDEKAVMHRADDIKSVIELGRAHHQFKKQQKMDPKPDPNSPSTLTWHGNVLPAIKPHKKSLLQLVIVARSKNDNKMHVLVSEKNVVHLPTCELNPFINIHVNIRKFLMDIFGSDPPLHKLGGIVHMEHYALPVAQNDGVLLTLVIYCKPSLDQIPLIDKYTWFSIQSDFVLESIIKIFTQKNKTILLRAIN